MPTTFHFLYLLDGELMFGSLRCLVFISFAIVFGVGSKLMVNEMIGFEPFFTSILAVMFGALGASQGTCTLTIWPANDQDILLYH